MPNNSFNPTAARLNSSVMQYAKNTLAQSDRFEISHEYEVVYLSRDGKPSVVIGDFYGDPQVAVIDHEEKWCAVGGHGLIVYFLEEPFDEYRYDQKSSQYFDVGREKDSEWWVESVQQIGAHEIQVRLESGDLHNISVKRDATAPFAQNDGMRINQT
ncbi:hypothetical protein AGMMS50256_24830 [Betaproteobacteria bacterium]|nr:hypothetical protein AGMMS50256_24830 [Betaproteobacteria bacterium]